MEDTSAVAPGGRIFDLHVGCRPLAAAPIILPVSYVLCAEYWLTWCHDAGGERAGRDGPQRERKTETTSAQSVARHISAEGGLMDLMTGRIPEGGGAR